MADKSPTDRCCDEELVVLLRDVNCSCHMLVFKHRGGSTPTWLLGDLYQTKTNGMDGARVGMLGNVGVSCGGCEGALGRSGQGLLEFT